MDKDKKVDYISQIRKDDRNLDVAGRGWEEDTKDPAVELLKEIRQDTEED